MPRNITVTFGDGTTHVYQNAPDNITPEQVTARAQQDFPSLTVTALDGGRANSSGASKPLAPEYVAAAAQDAASGAKGNPGGLTGTVTDDRPAPRGLQPSQAKRIWDEASANLERQIANLPDQYKDMARDRFFKDPRIARLREAAARPVTNARDTSPEHLADVARQAVQDRQQSSGVGDFLTGLRGGIIRGADALTLGAPTTLAALGERFLPSAITGNDTDASFSEILRAADAKNEAEADRSFAGNIIGQILSGGAIGGLYGKLAGEALAGTRVAQAAGKASAAFPRASRLASLAGAGAAAGTSDALSRGENPVRGGVEGAVAGPAVAGAARAGGVLAQRAADIMGIRGIGSILKSVTSATKEEIEHKIADFRAKGIEPTLFEVLPLDDQNRIARYVSGRSDSALEATQKQVQRRVANMGPEIAARAEEVTAPGRQAIADQMTQDIAAARGGQNLPMDQAVAARATRSGLDTDAVGDFEARTIMAPHDDQELFSSLEELLPQHPELQPDGSVSMVIDDPAVTAMIRRKAGLLRSKNADEASGGINGREVSDLLSDLRSTAESAGTDTERDIARAAVAHIEDILEQDHPDFLAANEQMRAARAARYRMTEGMTEGGRTRVREEIEPGQAGAEQRARNAYDTPEGARGRFLGQANELEGRFGRADPRAVIARAARLPADQVALERNLGRDPARAILETAEAQTQSARALAGLSSKRGSEAAELGPDDLAGVVLGLNPQAMIRTKVAAIHRLVAVTRLPEKQAKSLIDLLFSQNASKRTQALNMLNNKISNGKKFLQDLRAATVGGLAGAGYASETEPQPVDWSQQPELAPAIVPQASAAEVSTERVPDGLPYGHAVVAGLFPGAVVTSDVRSPSDDLSKKNPKSYHVNSDEAVDVRPIPGMTFEQFIKRIEDNGYTIIEKRDEEKHPIPGLTTGPHWHVVIG